MSSIFIVNTSRIAREPEVHLLAKGYAPLDLEPVEYPDPGELLRELAGLEREILRHTEDLVATLCDLGYATREELS